MRNRIFRKLQQQGGSLVVSLPKKWLDENGFEKEDSIAMEFLNEGSLRIIPKHIVEDQEETDEIIIESSPYISREIVRNILSGHTKIIIISDKEINHALRNQVRFWVNGLPITEITEESRQRIVIENFGYNKKPTKDLIHQLLNFIDDMFEDIKKGDYSELDYHFNQLRKFYFILVIHIRTFLRTGIYVSEDSDFDQLKAMDYRMLSEKSMEIGKILKNIRLTDLIKEYFDEVHLHFKEVITSYQRNDQKLAYYVWLKKEKLFQKAIVLSENLVLEDAYQIKAMTRISKKCKDMAALI